MPNDGRLLTYFSQCSVLISEIGDYLIKQLVRIRFRLPFFLSLSVIFCRSLFQDGAMDRMSTHGLFNLSKCGAA